MNAPRLSTLFASTLVTACVFAAACAPSAPVAPTVAAVSEPPPTPKPSPPPPSFGPPVFPTPRPPIPPPPAGAFTPLESPPPSPSPTPGPGESPGSREPGDAPPRNFDAPALGLHVATLHGPSLPGDGAGLAGPGGVAVTSGGVIYLADTAAHVLRVSRLDGGLRRCVRYAGDGQADFGDGVGLEASFNAPRGLVVGSRGRLFVADAGNHCLRVVEGGESPVVSRLVGRAGQSGHRDGVAEAALFNDPTALTLDAEGNLFVCDTGNHCIRKVTPAKVVTTVAGEPGLPGSGDREALLSRFSSPGGIAVTARGDLFVCDTGNHCIRRISREGQVTTYAGRSGEPGLRNGPGLEARFSSPRALTLGADGSLYVGDDGNRRLRRIDPEGGVTVVAGTGQAATLDGPGPYAKLHVPSALAWSASEGVLMADAGGQALRVLRFERLVTTDFGYTTPGDRDGSLGEARFRFPVGLAFDGSGNLFLADTANHVIRKLATDGVVTTFAGTTGQAGLLPGAPGEGKLSGPRGVVLDVDGSVYVADTENHAIRRISPAGRLDTVAGGRRAGFADGKGAVALFNRPTALALGPDGNLYVADQNNHRVRLVTREGAVTTLAGLGTVGFKDGGGTEALFSRPSGIAVDRLGRIWVSELGNHAVRLLIRDSFGSVRVRTVAGQGGQPGFQDGATSRLNEPGHLSLDASNRLYIADTGNSVIRRLEADGSVSTYAGSAAAGGGTARSGHLDGPVGLAQFAAPEGVLVDLLGYVHVVDTANHCVRRVH